MPPGERGRRWRRAPVDRAARELIAELAKGRAPRPEPSPPARRPARTEWDARTRSPRPTPSARSPNGWPPRPASGERARSTCCCSPMRLPHGQRVGKPLGFPPLDSTVAAKSGRRCATDEPSLPDKVIAIHEALRSGEDPACARRRLALAYYAEPRATIDIDLNVFVARRALAGRRRGARPLGVDAGELDSVALLRDGQCRLWWGENAVDLFFAYDPIHEEMRRKARRVPFAGDDRAVPGPRASRRLQGDVRPAQGLAGHRADAARDRRARRRRDRGLAGADGRRQTTHA